MASSFEICKQPLFSMSAGVKYLLPSVECAGVVVVQDVIFLFKTKSALLCDWVESWSLFDKIPFYTVTRILVF